MGCIIMKGGILFPKGLISIDIALRNEELMI